MATELTQVPSQNRFVFTQDGVQVGLVDYVMRGKAIHILHTEIDPALRRQGLGGQLVQAVLEKIRTETDLRVVAICPFTAHWLEAHPEYQELEIRG
jgi:uncharacterized protein